MAPENRGRMATENVVKRPAEPRKEVEDMKRTAGGPQGIVHNERKTSS